MMSDYIHKLISIHFVRAFVAVTVNKSVDKWQVYHVSVNVIIVERLSGGLV